MESHAQIKELRGRMKSLSADNRSLSAELIAAKVNSGSTIIL